MSRFPVLRARTLQSFNRRDFLRLGALSAALPVFDVKLPPGVDFTLLNSPTPQKYLLETMLGGVALFVNDGLLDIFLVNGGRVTTRCNRPRILTAAILAIGTASIAGTEDGSFTDVAEAAGLSKAGARNYGMGVAIGDYDNDDKCQPIRHESWEEYPEPQ